jgi:hypothetical protein
MISKDINHVIVEVLCIAVVVLEKGVILLFGVTVTGPRSDFGLTFKNSFCSLRLVGSQVALQSANGTQCLSWL